MKLLNGFNDNARRFPAKSGMPKPGWITSGRGTTPEQWGDLQVRIL